MVTSAAKNQALLRENLENPAFVAYKARQAAAGIESPFNEILYGPDIPEIVPLPTVAPMPKMQEITPMSNRDPGLSGLSPVGGEMIPAAIGALGSLGGPLATIAGVAGAGYGILQALGLGEGEGLFGIDVLGGDTQYRSGIPFGGPGLAEPPAEWVEKEWHVSYDWGRLQYYLVRMPSGRKKIALYNTLTKKWKVWPWRQPRLAVIGKNMPSHKMITRLRRNLKKHSADARTILKMTNPTALRSPRRRRR